MPEHTDAADTPLDFTNRLSATIAAELVALRRLPAEERLASRLRHYRGIGLPG